MSSVKVFSSNSCPWCTKVKDYLKSLHVDYEEVNVSTDRGAAMELIKKTRQMAVPVTQIGERYIIGYDPDAIASALKEEGLL